MSNNIKIDILNEECFICLNSHSKYITLKCCNKSNINDICLFNVFIHYMNTHNEYIPCPLCRQYILIKDYFSLEDCIILFSNLNDNNKQAYFQKFHKILLDNYIKFYHILEIDETNSNINILSNITYILYTSILLIVFILLMIWLIRSFY
jgi:hypothetical protein